MMLPPPDMAGVLDEFDQIIDRRGLIRVIPIAVCGFDQQIIGIFDGCRIAKNRPTRLPKVAAEHDLGGLLVFVDPNLDDGGAENMAGIAETTAHSGHWFQHVVIGDRTHLTQAIARVLHGIDGC